MIAVSGVFINCKNVIVDMFYVCNFLVAKCAVVGYIVGFTDFSSGQWLWTAIRIAKDVLNGTVANKYMKQWVGFKAHLLR